MRAGRIALVMSLAIISAGMITPRQVAVAAEGPCAAVGLNSTGDYQFVPSCPGRIVSPDGRHALVQRDGPDGALAIELEDEAGRAFQPLPILDDDMPLAVRWAPNGRWFYANHYVGSGQSILRLFEIAGGKAVERPALTDAATKLMVKHFPCLSASAVVPTAMRWGADGDRLVIQVASRLDACIGLSSQKTAAAPGAMPDIGWKPLWMIGRASTGGIDADSVRGGTFDVPDRAPVDGPYSQP